MYGCVFHKEDGFCEKFSDDRCKSYCVMGPCQYAIPSNADKIRQMSDEELADAIYSAVDSCPEGKRPEGTCVANAYDCRTCWLSWLKAPVEEVQDG